jgi:hypothetical protein
MRWPTGTRPIGDHDLAGAEVRDHLDLAAECLDVRVDLSRGRPCQIAPLQGGHRSLGDVHACSELDLVQSVLLLRQLAQPASPSFGKDLVLVRCDLILAGLARRPHPPARTANAG